MTSENFWLCVNALAASLADDAAVDAVESELRSAPAADREDKRQKLRLIAMQVSRVEIRMMAEQNLRGFQ